MSIDHIAVAAGHIVELVGVGVLVLKRLADAERDGDPVRAVIRGWGGYFATGNASTKFNQVDSYVRMRLRTLMRRRKGRNLRAGEMHRWTRQAFYKLGLHKLLGTICYPGRTSAAL